MPWWTPPSPKAGAQEACCGANPAQSSLGLRAKMKNGPTGPSAGQPRHSTPTATTQGTGASTPRRWRPGLHRPANHLHKCGDVSAPVRTQQLSTLGSPSLTLSRNIEVTLLLPGQLKRPWAQLPRSQHRPHLLSQKYLLPQWPRLMTPFLRGAQGSHGGGGMSSSRLEKTERG